MARFIPVKFFAVLSVVFLVGIFVFSGCLGRLSAFETESLSPSGVMAEDGFPANILFTAAFQNTSESQATDLAKLQPFFPLMGNVESENGPFSSLAKLGLSYEEDIVPLFSEKNRIVFGITEGETSIGYLSVQNRDAFSRIEEKLITSQGQSATAVENYKNADISVYPQVTIVKYKDLAFLLSQKDEAHALIDRIDSKKNLRNNATYRDVIAKLPTPYVGYFYLDSKAMVRQIEQKSQVASSFSPQSFLSNSAFQDLVSAYGFVLQAKEGGIALAGYIAGDKKAMKQAGLRFSDSRGSGRYFTDTISPKGLMFYNEGKNLKEAVGSMKTTSPEQYARYQEIVKTWLAMDLEKDITPWMDGAYLFSLYRNDKNAFPGLTLMVDSSRAIDSANNFTKTLFERLNAGLSVLLLQFDYLKSAVTLGEIADGSDALYRLSVDFSKLSEEEKANLPQQMSVLKDSVLSLTFGVKGNFFFVSLADNAVTLFDGGHLSDSEAYKEAVSLFSSPDGEILMVNVTESVSYLDSVLAELSSLSVLKAEDEQQFAKVREFLKPFSSVLFKIRAEDYDEYVEGFIKVGNLIGE